MPTVKHPTFLLVSNDDQALDALAASLIAGGNTVLRASRGAEALTVLAGQPVDVMVCAARLPDTGGAQLLAQVARFGLDLPAVLILDERGDMPDVPAGPQPPWTGLRRPWREAEVRHALQQALWQRKTLLERRRLGASVAQLEQELKAAREQAQAGAARAPQTRPATGLLQAIEEVRERAYAATVKLCATLVGLRDPSLASLAQTVAEHAHALALKMGLADSAAQDVNFAALLHHIGKLALPDYLLNKPFESLSPAERLETDRYPVIGASLLVGIEPLQTAALYIRHQNECFDGQGQPDRLAGDKIPLGARILSVAKGYHAMQRGSVDGQRHTPDQAIEFLRNNRGSRYDPAVVDAFLEVIKALTSRLLDEAVLCITTDELEPGMVLARDVLSDDGALLLTKEHVLDTALINRMRVLEQNTKDHLTVFVWRHAPTARTGAGG